MADPTSDPTPPSSRPSADTAPVTLRGGDLAWRPVAAQLRTVRLLSLGAVLVLPLLATVVVALLVTPWVWLGTIALVVGGAWGAWVVGRQVSAISPPSQAGGWGS